MAISDYKITDSTITTNGIVGQPDKLTGTAAENKSVFDKLVRDGLKGLFNGLIDELSGTGGAADVGASVAGLAAQNVAAALYELLQKVSARATISALTSHTESTSNPHSVTKAQVGLGNCDNTSDANKPVSTATRAAIDALALELSAQDGATEIGASVEGLAAQNVADALAELLGKISALKTVFFVEFGRTTYNKVSDALAQGKLPVILGENFGTYLYWMTKQGVHYFLAVATSGGVPNVLTRTLDTSNHWETNFLALATATELTAHTGDTNNPHAVTKAQVGLGNCDNTSDLNKPVSTATRAAIDNAKSVTIRTATTTAANAVSMVLAAESNGQAVFALVSTNETETGFTGVRLAYSGETFDMGTGYTFYFSSIVGTTLYQITLQSGNTQQGTYPQWGTLTATELASEGYVDDAIGAAIGGSY